MAAFVTSQSSGGSAPGGLTYTASVRLVTHVPTTVVLQAIVRNEGPGSFTIHMGGCPLGYRIYPSRSGAPKTPAHEFNPNDHPCLAIAFAEALADNEEYVMRSDLITLSGKVPPGHYDLSVTVYHDGLIREVPSGSVDIS